MMSDMYKKTSPPLPRQLYIEPTNRCNSRCNICVRTFSQKEPERDLSYENFRLITDQFPRLERVVLHGIGEPLLNRDIFRMVRHLKSRGAYVLFNSNAILLDTGAQKKLLDSGLDEYRVSIDSATSETYEKMRGVPFFNRVIENVKGLVELKKRFGKGAKISLWFVGTRENIRELPALIEIASEIGVDEVYLQRLTFPEKPSQNSIMQEENAIYQSPEPWMIELLNSCEDLAKEKGVRLFSSGSTTPGNYLGQNEGENHAWKKCTRPWNLSYITANGRVLPCCISPFSSKSYRELILGNAFEEPFNEIWEGNRYKALRAGLASACPPEFCRGCGTRWSL